MEYHISACVQNLKPSAIREIFKYAADPAVISLSAGNPAPEAFPAKEIAEISADLLANRPIDALQYSVTEGYPALRNRLAAYMKENHNVGREQDDIIITSGAQQVMSLAAKTLCDPGDVVICEAPSFIGSLNSFRSFNVRLRGVPMENDGMDIAALEQALKEEPRARFIYTIPNFQNPSGVTMSMEKRRAVYDLAKKYGVLILEDNPYGDIRFSGEPVPCIKSLDEDGLVLYAGTFSKVISPGIRVGYAIGPKPVLQKMIVCKQGQDVHTNIWSQIVCDEFMARYDYNAHLERLRKLYREKAAYTMDLMDRYLAPEITYNRIEGGLFLWCRLPDGVDMPAFCKESVLRKVCVVPGNSFLTDENDPCQSFRINYSTPTNDQLARGIEILGNLAKEVCR
ncbi:MAG TPA: PLP-dependent aminotransferase family protein [Candidatus Gallacutalibacter stercoravium]|nr:PLP-dependent aminotransferase family protein [Candidatus Gallacutalibacter stercoravium]